MKISTSKSRTAFLEEFDGVIQNFDQVLAEKMPAGQKIGLLKKGLQMRMNNYYKLGHLLKQLSRMVVEVHQTQLLHIELIWII